MMPPRKNHVLWKGKSKNYLTCLKVLHTCNMYIYIIVYIYIFDILYWLRFVEYQFHPDCWSDVWSFMVTDMYRNEETAWTIPIVCEIGHEMLVRFGVYCLTSIYNYIYKLSLYIHSILLCLDQIFMAVQTSLHWILVSWVGFIGKGTG